MKKLKDFKTLDKDQMKYIKFGSKVYEQTNIGGQSCSGCEPTSPNGGCFEVDGKCVWIPEIG